MSNLAREFEIELHPMFATIEDDLVMHPEEIAKMLGMSTESVRRWCRSGKLSSYNFGGKYIIIGDDFKKFMRKSRKLTNAEKAVIH
ncbi:helix-turn-helix domain-containing protein [Rossellomorea sp. NS-SX7]|uniref:helix-turn-helix domain-containing protein n=1 Tax=Rossellomorea sp. NS-SX7 TaxID=3463856 RepID=UPI004058FF8A